MLTRHRAGFERLLTVCDRFVLVVAAVSLVSPFIAAYHWKVSMTVPLLYSLVLAAALVLGRMFVPVRWAGLFVSAAVLLQVIDVGDTLRNDKTSPYVRMSVALKQQALEPGEIAFHRCPGRTYLTVGYYFDRCLRREDDWNALRADPAIRGVVTPRAVAEEEIPAQDVARGWRRVPLEDAFVLLMRR
jgi:hypothetical protein